MTRKPDLMEQIMQTNESTRKTRTIPEVAKVLGIGRNAAYEAARTGQIPTIRIGGRILVPLAALEKLLAA